MSTIAPYPLQWPENVARTPAGRRVRTPFKTGYPRALENIIGSLKGFAKDSGLRIDHPVLSSNVDLMGRLLDNDPGAAVWFMMDGHWVAFAVDRFPDTASNAQAIHHIIEARRVELRYGGLAIVRQTFRSFTALPAPSGTKAWHVVLDIPPTSTREQIEAAWRELMKRHHPDKGGTAERAAEINRARDEGLRAAG